MASTRTLTKSINMSFLQNNNKIIYVSLLVILSFFLFLVFQYSILAYKWGAVQLRLCAPLFPL